MADVAYFQCITPNCERTYDLGERVTKCGDCRNLLDVQYEWDQVPIPSRGVFDSRRGDNKDIFNESGVWRFREFLPFVDVSFREGYKEQIVSLDGQEGKTKPLWATPVAEYCGMDTQHFYLQFEGQNPTGSFKDNGMSACFTHAQLIGATKAICASTGNTSASAAAYAGNSGFLEAIILIGDKKIAYGKLSQALDYGGKTIQIREGDFDDAMAMIDPLKEKFGIYVLNSVNPARLEGQKTIMYRVLEGLDWQVPDYIVVPGGNLGNSSAFGKAFMELKELGLIKKVPKIIIAVAKGANTLSVLYNERNLRWNGGNVDDSVIEAYRREREEKGIRAHTLASAIEINEPVNLKKALRTLDFMGGHVVEVTDQEIMDAKAIVARSGMFGCEPASAATVAAIKILREAGELERDARIVSILTGHPLKDPDATVGYHAPGINEKLRRKFEEHGVTEHPFSNPPLSVSMRNGIEALEELLR